MGYRHLSDFKLGEIIDVGTVGTVYRAELLESGQEVALKMLLPSVSKDRLITARFEREMVILQKLTHPNIVRYYGGGREDHQYFYAMEMLDHGTLRDLLERTGPLSWQETASCGRQICSALQYAHNHGIIHRDLKPSNLFITENGEIKLGDFGTARDTKGTDLTSSGMLVGTHAYMAPEQIRGEKSITGQIDLYALGCVLFEMLVGHPPFQGENFADLFQRHLNEDPPHVRRWVPDCPLLLDETILRLLQKTPEQRPFNARQVQGMMMRLLEEPRSEAAVGEDVGASTVLDRGQRALSSRIARLDEQNAMRDVSWRKIAVLSGLVIIICLAAWWLNN